MISDYMVTLIASRSSESLYNTRFISADLPKVKSWSQLEIESALRSIIDDNIQLASWVRCCFTWKDTQEGYEFWHYVCYRAFITINDGECSRVWTNLVSSFDSSHHVELILNIKNVYEWAYDTFKDDQCE